MSFIIAVFVNEGIVLASDSRTTYNYTKAEGNIIEKQIGLHTTDTTNKTFLANKRIGISYCGDASIGGIPISGYIEDYIRQNIAPETDIDSVPTTLIKYFQGFATVPETNFIVAGYKEIDDNLQQRVYKVQVASGYIESVETKNQGAAWDGEIMTLTKIIQNTALKNPDGTYTDLPHFEIPWNLFTLSDAIGFAKYSVDATINSMRYQLVVETVGGPVDILVIKPSESFWYSKKNL